MQLVLKFIISLYIIILISVIATDILNSSTNKNIDETNKKEKKTTCEKIIEYSKIAKGTPYVWGGESLSGMDCSGFIHWMSIQLDSPVPRTTSQRYYLSTKSSDKHWKDAKCGNLVWWTFSLDRPYGHVGIITHTPKFWQSGSSTGVTESQFWKKNYWDKNFSSCKSFFN